MKLILSLCDYSGTWSQPYRDAGYQVEQVDLKLGQDLRLLPFKKGVRVHGLLCAPDCTEFAGSGARWWAAKGEGPLLDALALADACTRFVALYRPQWWALENPVGRLSKFYGPAAYSFNPNEFAGYSDEGEAYTKKTLLWGEFNKPIKKPLPPTLGSKMHLLPPSENRKELRSVTPKGFALAFFNANP